MLASKNAVVSVRPAMALAPMRRSRAGVKVHSAAAATVLVEQAAVTVDAPVASASKGMTRAEVAALYKKMEAKAKAIIALEEVKAASRPTVRISLRSRVGLGEQWKIVGNCPELGRMHPENAPAMNCTDGELWVLETPIRHGSHTFKAVLRNFEGAYIWEAGNDRKLELPVELGKDDKVNVELSVKMPF